MTGIWRSLVCLAAAWLLALPTLAHCAEEEWEHQRAKKLFDTALGLMDRGNFATACPMLEESLRLEVGMGTRYYLARCYEKVGRLASAYRMLLKVAEEADKAGRHAREEHARNQARKLEPRVPQLTVTVPSSLAASKTLVVTLDGSPLPRSEWNRAVPVDLGERNVVARQQGSPLKWERKTWITEEGQRLEVRVPELDSLREPTGARPEGEGSTPGPAGLADEGPDTAEPSDKGGVDGLLIAGIGSAALAVTSIVMFNWARAEVEAIESDGGFITYREGFPDGSNVCELATSGYESPGAPPAAEIADQCDRAESMEVVQGVMLPASIAFSALATVLIVMSDTVSGDDEPDDLNVGLHLGDRSGGLWLRYRF